MDYAINTAMLPQDELWTIEHAWEMAEVITPEIPQIDDEKGFLDLIRHAWLWDKNAMIQYARIQVEVNEEDVLDNFIRRNAYRIVDQHGVPLKRPEIFNMNYSAFIIKLADMGYPLASRLAANKLLWSAGETGLIHNPLTQENHERLIRYTQYAINGGYQIHLYLADYILFDTAFSFKDSNNKKLNSLSDRTRSLSTQDLNKSFAAYTVSALHGSQYAQIRLSEFYFNGIGFDRNIEMACAWSVIASESFMNFDKKYSSKYSLEKSRENIYNNYNRVNLLYRIQHEMTVPQLDKCATLISQIKDKIIWDDYYQWESSIANVLPKP